MSYTEEQVKEVKRQIFEQTKQLPEAQRKQIEEQIDRMSADELETFVNQQMSAQQQPLGQQAAMPGQPIAQSNQTQKGIFRMIIDGEVPSKKIDENQDVVAVVSVRPVSKGHTLIIPKKPVTEAKSIPSSALALAKKISGRMTKKLKAKSVEVQSQNIFGETVINVIPVYDIPVNINSSPYEAKEEELEEVYKLLQVVKKKKVIKVRTKPNPKAKIVKLKRRIP